MTRPGLFLGGLPLLGLIAAGPLHAACAASALAPLAIVDVDVDADAARAAQAPPGMVLVTAGKVMLGTPIDEIMEIAAAHSVLKRAVAGEYAGKRGHEVEHGAFYVQATEVTNEQYAEFVRATGHQPPIYWARTAIDEAAQAFNKEQARLRQEAREAGETNPERILFDEFRWWQNNWREADWQVPEGAAAFPVTMVSYRDAEAYAAWAGLRLPSEAEWMAAAARGDEFKRFPWGEDWDDAKAITSTTRPRSEASPVGSAPEGAVMHGTAPVFDMAGNVWEWTSSYLEALPGYKASDLVLETGTGRNKRTSNLVARFDVDENIVKGGSFGNDDIAARLSTRQGQQRGQQLELLGFRCVADLDVGRTLAANIDENLPNALRPGGPLSPELALVRDRYVARAGSTEVPGYKVITGYEHLAFVPVAELEERSGKDLTRTSVNEAPIGMGIFSTTVEILEPALQPGMYLVAYRGPGKDRGKRDRDEEPENGNEVGAAEASLSQDDAVNAAGEPFDLSKANLIFYDESGSIAGALPIEELDTDKLDRGIDPSGTFRVEGWVEPKRPDPALVPVDTVTIESFVPSAGRRTVFKTPLVLKVAKDAIDGSWRE